MVFLSWIIVGLIAGWLAGQVMKGGGYGMLVDIILGILGECRRVVIRAAGDLAGSRMDRLDHRGFRRRGDPCLDHALAEKSVSTIREKQIALP